jgi:hypothetical protein
MIKKYVKEDLIEWVKYSDHVAELQLVRDSIYADQKVIMEKMRWLLRELYFYCNIGDEAPIEYREKIKQVVGVCDSGCTYSRSMNQSFPRECVICGIKEGVKT